MNIHQSPAILMQRKLKSIFGSKRRRRAHPSPAREKRAPRSPIEGSYFLTHAEPSRDLRAAFTPNKSRSGPDQTRDGEAASEAKHDRRSSVESQIASDNAHNYALQNSGGAPADHYKLYVHIPGPDDLADDLQFMSLGGDRRLTTDESERKHHEEVADQNIERYSSSLSSENGGSLSLDPSCPNQEAPRKDSTASYDSTDCSIVSSLQHSKHVRGLNGATPGGHVYNNIWSSKRDDAHQNWADWPPRSARAGSQNDKNETPMKESGSQRDSVHKQLDEQSVHDELPKTREDLLDLCRATIDGQQHTGQHFPVESEEMDRVTRWAPAVTKEIIQPTEHNIVTKQIHREIHNHDVYHRIQPVYQTEILPPRHFIPSPSGDGLIEVTEDDMPECKDFNERWFAGGKQRFESSLPTISLTERPKQFREPIIINGDVSITPEGFERNESIIFHPPTLVDMSDYNQPALRLHFDHATGETWEESSQGSPILLRAGYSAPDPEKNSAETSC